MNQKTKDQRDRSMRQGPFGGSLRVGPHAQTAVLRSRRADRDGVHNHATMDHFSSSSKLMTSVAGSVQCSESRSVPFGCGWQLATSDLISSRSTWVPVSSAGFWPPSPTSGFGLRRSCELSYAHVCQCQPKRLLQPLRAKNAA